MFHEDEADRIERGGFIPALFRLEPRSEGIEFRIKSIVIISGATACVAFVGGFGDESVRRDNAENACKKISRGEPAFPFSSDKFLYLLEEATINGIDRREADCIAVETQYL